MKSVDSSPGTFGAEITDQPSAIRAAAHGLGEQSAALKELRRVAAGARIIVFTGMGASYAACRVPVTLLSECGVPTIIMDSAELLHFGRPILRAETLLVAVSQSGRSAELVRLMEAGWPDGSPTIISVTNGLDNPLARAATVRLDTRAGREAGPSTKTFAGALTVLSAVYRLLLTGRPIERPDRSRRQAERAAEAIEALLDRQEEIASQLIGWLGDRRYLTVLGRGTALACAEMAALLMKEAARFPAESLGTAQFRHGPIELAGPELAVAVMATEAETIDLDLSLAADLVGVGASVLVVSPFGTAPQGAVNLAVGPSDRALAGAVATVPFQLLASRLAAEGGRDPGQLQVASKVTQHE